MWNRSVSVRPTWVPAFATWRPAICEDGEARHVDDRNHLAAEFVRPVCDGAGQSGLFTMPSQSLKHWNERSATALNWMEAAHHAVRGTGRGGRHATQQINQSYLVLLSSHFQQFCRSLHSEAVNHLARNVDTALRPIMLAALNVGRNLDQGNPNPGNLGADFGRLGMRFWHDVTSFRRQDEMRKASLARMGHWRNAIAHQDFASATHVLELGGRTEIRLQEVRAFRLACSWLALDFDAVVLAHIKAVAGPHAGW